MRIGCLQFAPVVGDVDNNLNRADAVLNRADPQDLDLLVLPELAFSGYNFKSLQHISNFLEPPGSGISSLWARTQALKHDCAVVVGYPEKVDLASRWPANPEYYNAAHVVSYEGETVANYRKAHLYYTDETWALEGTQGFFGKPLPGLGKTAIGICMDLNPYKFQAPWDKFEFACHVLDSGAKLVIVSMAWITQEDPRRFSQRPQEPDMNTLTYWISRLEPIIRAESDEEVIVVFANRTGTEDEATYAGTSAVVGIKSGEVRVYGILGRGEKDLLVVDTDSKPYAKLVFRPEGETLEVNERGHAKATDDHGSVPNGTEQQAFKRSPSPPAYDEGDSRDYSSHSNERRNSSYRREDLSIKVLQKWQYEKQFEDPSIHTPSAPSPTPQNIRPQVSTQPSESLTQRYLDSRSPTSHDSQPFSDEGPLIIDPEATARRLGLIRDTSPSIKSDSHHSEYSTLSSQLYWTARKQQEADLMQRPWTGFEDVDEIISDYGSVTLGRENRHSIRSDVSVWNNQPGRPRDMAMLPTPPQETGLRSTLHALERGVDVAPPRAASRTVNRPQSRTQRSSKSRSASRTRGLGRSNSSMLPSMLPAPDMVAVRDRFEDMAHRAESAQGRFASLNMDKRATSGAASSRRDSRAATSSRQIPTNPSAPPSHARSFSNESISIPIAMDPSLFEDMAQPPQTNVRPQAQPPKPSTNDPPILRPASRSRIGSRSTSHRGPDLEIIPVPNSNLYDERIQSARPAADESRAISRGRTRSAKPPHTADPIGVHGQRPGSHRRQNPSVDLSQFHLIEEYPSPHCPLHGSRSRSRARQGNSSRQRTPATGRTQPPPSSRQQRSGSRRPTQNTPVSTVRKAQATANAASRSTTDLTLPLRAVDSPAPRSRHNTNDSVDTMTSSASTLSPGQEPKTPVAMVLISELEDSRPKAFVAPLKCVDKSADLGITRPRSAVW